MIWKIQNLYERCESKVRVRLWRKYRKQDFLFFPPDLYLSKPEPHSSVSGIADLRTRCHWFDPLLGQYSIQRLMIVTVTVFIPLSRLSIVSSIHVVTW